MPGVSSNRRDFITGRAARAAVDAVGEALADRLGGAALSGGDVFKLVTRAMACDFAVFLPATAGPARLPCASEALDRLHPLEDQMTVYRAHSEMSQINRRAAHEAVEVEPRLFSLLCQARDIARATGGAFDPTSGPLIALWRRCREQGRIPTQTEINAARALVGIEHVIFDEETRTIRYDRPGVELNLGAIGKGHALDRCGEFLLEQGMRDWLFHGGHSSILARGSQCVVGQAFPSADEQASDGQAQSEMSDVDLAPAAGDDGEARGAEGTAPSPPARVRHWGWPVAIRHPLFPAERYATIILRDQALSTSGSGVQFFRYGGKRYGHILDPRSGWPVEDVLSVTVLAPTAAEADALSTAFFVMGLEKAREYCDTDPRIGALLIPPPRRGRTLKPVICNIPDDALSFDNAS